MSEKFPGSVEPPRPTITHDEAIRYPEFRNSYVAERVELIKLGEPVWMLRNFDDDSDMERGTVLDYYQGGGLRGYVDGNELDGFQVYGPEIEEGEGSHHLNTEPVGLLSEAKKSLADYIRKAYLEIS